jgi:hypothetical protein
MNVAALFVRRTSHYKAMPGVDCYDEDRDALTWPGGVPAVFHPPCRLWSRLAHHVKDAPAHELALGLWSVAMCRRFGGVVEHPKDSRLWSATGCMSAGVRDPFGGVLVTLEQGWFGHRAPKETALYIVGAPAPDLSAFVFTAPAPGRVMNMCKAEREATPLPFAELLVDLARQASLRLAA